MLNLICVNSQAVGFVSAHRHGPGGGPPPSGMPDAQGGGGSGGAGESSGQESNV